MELGKLKAYLRFKNIPYRVVSKGVKMAINTFSNKINNSNNQEFTHTEIILIKDFLGLSNEEVIEYFF